MKVAIVGAGVAGLSCLHELERLGVYADVFEQLNVPGRIFPWMGANLGGRGTFRLPHLIYSSSFRLPLN